MATEVLGKNAINRITRAEGIITGYMKFISGEEMFEITLTGTGQSQTVSYWSYPGAFEIAE
jgi:hypothetical protein